MGNCLIVRRSGGKQKWFTNLYCNKVTSSYSSVIDTKSTLTKTWHAYGYAVKWNSNRWMYVKLQGSNDNSNWADISTLTTGCPKESAGGTNGMFSTSGTSSYRYYRIEMTVQTDNYDTSGTIATLILEE